MKVMLRMKKIVCDVSVRLLVSNERLLLWGKQQTFRRTAHLSFRLKIIIYRMVINGLTVTLYLTDGIVIKGFGVVDNEVLD